MKRISCLFAIAVAGSASSQVMPVEFGVGYAKSESFARADAGRGTLSGPEFTIQQRMLAVPLLGEATVGASILFGGALAQGNDADGTVYRLFARGRSQAAGPEGLYILGGPFFAFGSGRGGSFGSISGVGFDLGVGFPLAIKTGLPGMPSSSLEIINHSGPRAELRGWSIGIVFRM